MTSFLSDRLSGYIAQFDEDALPSPTLHAAKRVLLDATGVMLGASGMAQECAPFVALAETGSTGNSAILGTGKRVSPTAAAFANGAFAHALDFEDAFDLVPGHPNASLIPALLALAQAEGAIDGTRFLNALVIGCDTACRMALALRQRMEVGGWYPPPILGGFGAVAGAARLLGLDAGQVRDALSLLLCQTTMPGEIKFSAGTQIRAVREAFPAQAAVQSVLLARDGVKGFESPLEGKAGFYALYADGKFSEKALLDDLGGTFWIEQLTFKPWPSCRGTHPFIEMALDLQMQHNFAPQSISAVTVFIDPIQRMLVEPKEEKTSPPSAIEAKFSIQFATALALCRGGLGLENFTPADLQDAQVLALANKFSVGEPESPDWHPGSGGALKILLDDGTSLESQLHNARGCPARPMDDDELRKKFVTCVAKAAVPVSADDANRLADAIMSLENCDDVGRLFA